MQLQGQLYFEYGTKASGVPLRFYRRLFGGSLSPIGELVTSDSDGHYEFAYQRESAPFHLEINAVASDGVHEYKLADTVFNAHTIEVLNLIVPAELRPLLSEYARLMADINPQVPSGAFLVNAQERDTRRDVSLLNRSTQWDARLITLAVIAGNLSISTGIGAEALYGMLRAGLPRDAEQLAYVSGNDVSYALIKMVQRKIIALNETQISAAATAFATFARTKRRAARNPKMVSTYGEMLALSGVSEGQRDTVEDLLRANQGNPAQLWQALSSAGGLPVERMKITAKLGYLTMNSAPLISTMLGEMATVDDIPDVLVENNLYRVDAWIDRLESIEADPAGMDSLLPPGISGGTVDERVTAYAADLARKVRLSYPTHVIRNMIATDELSLGPSHEDVKDDVAEVLKRASALGYSLGKQPFNVFVRDNHETLFDEMTPERADVATGFVKTLARLYQITPTDEALKVLLEEGFRSAHDVTSMPKEKFLRRYGDQFPSKQQAESVYKKSQQVSSVTYTFFGAAKQMDAPPLYATSPPVEDVQEAKNSLIEQFPSMEALFGDLDYCACDHCRSVLSPAAYLVDLLHFLDIDDLVWDGDMDEWAETHGGAPYPFAAQAAYDAYYDAWEAAHGLPVPDTDLTPYEVLLERRPDLPELPLTCENTNTVLPYIDIVNEILEYYIAHGALNANAVFDNGGVNTADLIAEPQHIVPEAYTTLKQARYPLTLPFDLWLETVRRFCSSFDTPLWRVLEAMRTNDALYPATGNTYGRAAVFLERLGISADEYAIFTDTDPEGSLRALYGYEPDALNPVPPELSSAKTLARRLGVTYKEIVELVCTGFVNPRLETLVTLRKLGLDIEDVMRYKEKPGFPAFSAEESAVFEAKLGGTAGVAWLNQAWTDGAFENILVLSDPNAGCGFETTTLRFVDDEDGTEVDSLTFVKINYLVRLSRRLKWSITETARALQTFVPQSLYPLGLANLKTAMATALLGIAHLDALNTLLKGGPKQRQDLLFLWSPLTDARYAELFLTGTKQDRDPVFDHPLGQYLRYLDANDGEYKPFHWDVSFSSEDQAAGKIALKNHLGPVLAALELTTEEVEQILADNTSSLGAAPLSISTLSLLYRHGLLAKLLKRSISDLLILKALSELNPWHALQATPVSALDQDHPYWHTQRFVELDAKIKASGLPVADLDYLVRHHFDPVGPDRGAASPPLSLIRALVATIDQIKTEHTPNIDPLKFTDDIIRQKLGLVLPSEVVDMFFALWTGTLERWAAQSVAPGEPLDPDLFANEPAIRLRYDAESDQQILVYRGVLTQAQATALQSVHTEPLFATLINSVQGQVATVITTLGETFKKAEFGEGEIGFLEPNDYDHLFDPPPPGLDEVGLQSYDKNRRQKLLEGFLPYLQTRLIRRAVIQAVATDLGATPDLTEVLLTTPALLDDPDHVNAPLLDVYVGAEQRGVTTTTDPDGVDISGYFEVPVTGPYQFSIRCRFQDTKFELRFDHLADPAVRGKAASDDDEIDDFVELRAGVVYGFSLHAEHPSSANVELYVQGEQTTKRGINGLGPYPRDNAARIQRVHILLAKTLRIINALSLTEREVRHFTANAGDFSGFDLGALPTQAGDSAPDLFDQLLHLIDYVELRRLLSADPDDLVDLLAHGRRTYAPDVDHGDATAEVFEDVTARLARITRRAPEVVRAAASTLGMVADVTEDVEDHFTVTVTGFTQEQGLRRLWDVLSLIAQLGVAPEAIKRWATPAPTLAVARDVRDTVKAKYNQERWRRFAQPIFDHLRQRRRDALVAHIVHTGGFDRMEQLFEYFLVDPGTEPVVQTSRLRLALSSVQLFIQRCLLNLEPKVHPSAINSAHWQWMKRYRVWEANRKIFLFPENWLEPEWRDDKTHLYSELEGALSQADLTNERAEAAFFGYLSKLEELSRLDIRAMYLEERPDPGSNVLHVVARTFGAPHKYFYRSYAHAMWTPWVPVTVDIEGDHVTVAVWRGRVHLFWVTFLEKSSPPDMSDELNEKPLAEVPLGAVGNTPAKRDVEVRLSWTEYFQGEWTNPASSGFLRRLATSKLTWFTPRYEFVHVTVESDDSVWIRLTGDSLTAIRLVSKNSEPTTELSLAREIPPYSTIYHEGPGRFLYKNSLSVTYSEEIITENGQTTMSDATSKPILGKTDAFLLVLQSAPLRGAPPEIGPLVKPFFFADVKHTFFVEPTLTETTIEEWEEPWLSAPAIDLDLGNADKWKYIDVSPQVPVIPEPIESISPLAKYNLQVLNDWISAPAVKVAFDGAFIGAFGEAPEINIEGNEV